MQRAAAALTAMQTMQAQARTSVPPITVPNGLGMGGLQPVDGAVANSAQWMNAQLPTQTAGGGQTNVTVTQTGQKAILNWRSFNVGQNTTLNFDQSAGGAAANTWVALNRVSDPAAQPSQILGRINAPGQVYVVNHNGIIFGGGSQINTAALIASTADITDDQFLNSGIYSTQTDNAYNPSFTGAAGSVIVQAGALLTTNTPMTAVNAGGYVMLLGGRVENDGIIATPNGQVIMAAGTDFVLRPGYSVSGTDANGNSVGNLASTTRGSEIAVVNGNGGVVANNGLLLATTGDITLAGQNVSQTGVAIATTSVSARGTIHLLTNTSDVESSVTLAPGSVTLIQPDQASPTALNSQLEQSISTSNAENNLRSPASLFNDQVATIPDQLFQSRVEITTGGVADFQGGSLTIAKGGQIAVSAGRRVLAESGAQLDVSGTTDTMLPASADILKVSIESNELRDAPVNRVAGLIRNSTVAVDALRLVLVPASSADPTDRYYTAGGLLEVSGYLNTTPHTIGEFTAAGGTITLASKEVVSQPGSVFNIAGGAVSYQSGFVPTSWLLASNGGIYNVNTAPANLTYTGVFGGFNVNHPRWGVTDTYNTPLVGPSQIWQSAYTVGRDAGALVVSAPTVIAEGTINAGVVDGQHQNAARSATVDNPVLQPQGAVPLAGALRVGDYTAIGLSGTFDTQVELTENVAAIANTLSFGTPIPDDRVGTAYFSASQLSGFGLGTLAIATQGNVSIDAPLTLSPGGTLTLTAATTAIDAPVTAPGASVVIGNTLQQQAFVDATGAAGVTLTQYGTIDTRGLWTNALLDPSAIATEAFLNGGNVTLQSTGSLILASGSVIDASSGGAVLSSGKTKGGQGGNISLSADTLFADIPVGTAPVVLAGTLRSYGVTHGGALSITAASVLISDAATAPAVPNQLVLPSSLFGSGFSSYTINGLADQTDAGGALIPALGVAPGTSMTLVEPVLQFDNRSFAFATGSDAASALTLALPPVYVQDPTKAKLTQRAGAGLSLQSELNPSNPTGGGGSIAIGAGSVITADPGQAVRIDAFGQITVGGAIHAPGGSITIANHRIELGPNGRTIEFLPGLSIWIGGDATLDVAAQAAVAQDRAGRPYGIVPAGGAIQLGSGGGTTASGLADRTDAFVVLRPGSVLDASGTSAVIDLLAGTTGLGGTATSPTLWASNGGTISVSSTSGIYLDGTLRAVSGGATASGGTLALSLTTPAFASLQGALVPPEALGVFRQIVLGQTAAPSPLPGTVQPGDKDSPLVVGAGALGVDQIAAGGFDSLSLTADLVVFDGSVTLHTGQSIALHANLATTDINSTTTIAAPYILIDGSGANLPDLPTLASNASLAFMADQIDVLGGMSFGLHDTSNGVFDRAGFADVAFTSAGDIRFLGGTLAAPSLISSTGNLTFTAAQLYPASGAVADIAAGLSVDAGSSSHANQFNAASTLTITRSTDVVPATPPSVGGSLTLWAGTVNQGGILRAPEGTITLGTIGSILKSNHNTFTTTINLLPGSVTSVSGAGVTVPYGGTADGVTYTVNGMPTTANTLGASLTLAGQSISVGNGATLDLSGGGQLTGAAFISGSGGSTDTLTTPLMVFNPAAGTVSTPSLQTAPVYAIVPSQNASYAPGTTTAGVFVGATPAVGEQITIPAGVPGLPAGTYTLMPANYALLPGAFRVELETTTRTMLPGAIPLGNGSYQLNGTTGTANTPFHSTVPIVMTLTPGQTVRTYSQYDEMSYGDFVRSQAALFGNFRTVVPEDAKALNLTFIKNGNVAAPAFTMAGTVLFGAAPGGFGGVANVTTPGKLEITAPNSTPSADSVAIQAADLNRLGATTLSIGGSLAPPSAFVGGSASLTVDSGAVLSAPQVFLISNGGITLQDGAIVNTLGFGPPSYDSNNGFLYSNGILAGVGATVLAVSNGFLNFLPSALAATGPITIGNNVGLYTDGTIAFSTNGSITLSTGAQYGAQFLELAVQTINLGSDAALAGSTVPTGVTLGQDVLSALLRGNPDIGTPALKALILTAGKSVNFFGSTDISTVDPVSGQSLLQQFVLNTPAIYGDGTAGDAATLSTGTFIWNGVATGTGSSATTTLPPGVVATGPGTGAGSFTVNADHIIFGYSDTSQPNNQVTLGRTMFGFSDVNFIATSDISANNKGSLSVYAAQGANFGDANTGGNLNLVTPLLTGAPGSVMSFAAGGAISVRPPSGSTPSLAQPDALGAEISLTGATVSVASTIAAPSGRLTITADGDIVLSSGSRLDVHGVSTGFFDQTADSWGGDILLQSTHGSISQAADALIDVSAGNADAGSLSATATSGTVAMDGTILGSAGAGHSAGSFTANAGTLPDFVGLNQRLNAGGVFGARSFDIKTGSLTIGNDPSSGAPLLRANTVSVSVDNGDLTVNGTVDASGPAPGTITLSTGGSLTLEPNAVLDAHGTTLQTDSNGQPIDAKNRATVSLTVSGNGVGGANSGQGMLTLQTGAVIDVSAPDGVARGDVELNAPRVAETGNDIRISASGALDIRGASTIAVNGFWTYSPGDAAGTVMQDNGNGASGAVLNAAGILGLNQINASSTAFVGNAVANPGLLARLAGLTGYEAAFHLRPGVEIDSTAGSGGNLTVAGDLDLSGMRYVSLNPASQQTGLHGSGEPGVLLLRAANNLNIYGSITDGFAPPPDGTTTATQNPDDNGWFLRSGTESFGSNMIVPQGATVVLKGDPTATTGTSYTNADVVLNYDIPIQSATLNASVVIPVAVTLAQTYTVPGGGWTATSNIYAANGGLIVAKGTIMPAGFQLQQGWTVGAGSVLPFQVTFMSTNALTQVAQIWPAGANLNLFAGPSLGAPAQIFLNTSTGLQLAAGDLIPATATVQFVSGTSVNLRAPVTANGVTSQGQVWAVAPLLAAGDDSWSMRLVSGADLGAADTRTVLPTTTLAAQSNSGDLAPGSITLSDLHYQVIPGLVAALNKRLPSFSVIRTGTGDLDLIAGGNFTEQTAYGIYTSGTQSNDVTIANPRGLQSDGTVVGTKFTAYNAVIASQSAYFPTNGGDLVVSAQGDLMGSIYNPDPSTGLLSSSNVGNWLWRQGGEGQDTAWWINFGSYVLPLDSSGKAVANGTVASGVPLLAGFTGFGTLGGGNVSILAGENAGTISNITSGAGARSTGLDVAVAGSGRMVDGTLVQTGGGDLTMTIGGALNPASSVQQLLSLGGTLTGLRGNITLLAGAVGQVGLSFGASLVSDPRNADPLSPGGAVEAGGIVLVPGDATVVVDTRGDLVLGTVGDATRFAEQNTTPYSVTVGGQTTTATNGGRSWFSLWKTSTSIDLFSAGGNLTPNVLPAPNTSDGVDYFGPGAARVLYPSTLVATAASGSIYYGAPPQASSGAAPTALELAPSATGQVEFLAHGTIYGNQTQNGPTEAIDISGADLTTLATPAQPAFSNGLTGAALITNTDPSAEPGYRSLFAFGPDTVTTNLHADDTEPARFYAVTGDVVDFITGQLWTQAATGQSWYRAAKPVWIMAGRDIVNTGTRPGSPQAEPSGANPIFATGNVFLNNRPTDVSVLQAGRDIIFANVAIAGPGSLYVQAGRNVYQADHGILESVGPLVDVNPANRNAGAGITVLAGVGSTGPDWSSFADAYLNPANLANPLIPLQDQPGKVVRTYSQTVQSFLQQQYGFVGIGAEALAFFQALPLEQQRGFLLQVYFSELNRSGLDFNDPTSRFFKSYIEGNDAIAQLFPTRTAVGAPAGDITLFGGSGIRTDFGGSIQILAPNGATTLGVASSGAPPSTAGVITQGSGDVQIFSDGSVLLGQSRIFTTFGGNILVWSAEGDINAGRGSKSTVVFTPAQIAYDRYGNISLSPSVPSTGAGIATLAPIAQVPPGDVNLVAPLGTIDAGEAGIRASGNANLAALLIVNAANIQVQGKTTGLPVIAVPNVAAQTAASAAAGAADKAAEQSRASRRNITPSTISVEVVGFGEQAICGNPGTPQQDCHR